MYSVGLALSMNTTERAKCFLLFPVMQGNCLAAYTTLESNKHFQLPQNTDKPFKLPKLLYGNKVILIFLLSKWYIWTKFVER